MRLDERSSYAFGSCVFGSSVGRLTTVFIGSVIAADVGEMSIVGANSFVNETVGDRCLVVGNPAEVIKELG